MLRPVGASAGLHVFAWLPPGVDEAGIVRRAAEAGVGIYGLSRYGYVRSEGPGGLIFGYGAVHEGEIVEGIRLVAEAMPSGSVQTQPAPSLASAEPVGAGRRGLIAPARQQRAESTRERRARFGETCPVRQSPRGSLAEPLLESVLCKDPVGFMHPGRSFRPGTPSVVSGSRYRSGSVAVWRTG